MSLLPVSSVRKGQPLSPAEKLVFPLIVLGLSNAEIAKHLKRSEKTIKFHCMRIFVKCDVTSRGKLIAGHYLGTLSPDIRLPQDYTLTRDSDMIKAKARRTKA